MTTITSQNLVDMFLAIAGAIEEKKDHLSELDGVIGDADHGVTMHIGFSAVKNALTGLDTGESDPATVFNTAAKSFLNAVGASSGPLYATAFMRAGAAAKGKGDLDRDAMIEVFGAMAKGIQDRGKAERGDKTMVDAWAPAAEAIAEAAERGAPLAECFDAAAKAAEEGAEATKAMRASKGRASRLGERSLGHMDPGAASTALIVGVMAKSLAAA
ncbi:dihydroxyacetone kinase subunit DhaL [Jiella marina]|uniref:dihydroxyacetone kinase subunit DhaL n=1 Tax=Jiella sp. LLJ827 TaxID=2917712 RepID=UPI002100FD83|nr:dihydroxyacetone kinase subunit DhaL [Jiella sp. LLJ827]MCQ0986675.1 dihydroxyacetone kinase subunit L [Jiella sp. LLJ827]